jgi:hypothetical protein
VVVQEEEGGPVAGRQRSPAATLFERVVGEALHVVGDERAFGVGALERLDGQGVGGVGALDDEEVFLGLLNLPANVGVYPVELGSMLCLYLAQALLVLLVGVENLVPSLL